MDSYLYTKRFIDQQVKILNQPLVIDDRLRALIAQLQLEYGPDSISESQLQKVLQKTNARIRRHNAAAFLAQVTNQIVQQVLKLELYKLAIVNEQLAKIRYILRPLLLPDFNLVSNDDPKTRLRQFELLIKELPESQYLIVDDSPMNKNEQRLFVSSDEESDSEDEDDNLLVEDDAARVEEPVSSQRLRSHYTKKLKEEVNRQIQRDQTIDQLLAKYDELRLALVDEHSKLLYLFEKIQYLKSLKNEIQNTLGISLPGENNKKVDHEIYDSDEEEDEVVGGVSQLQSNLVTNDHNSSARGLLSEINRFRVLVEKLSYKISSSDIGTRELREELAKLSKGSSV